MKSPCTICKDPVPDHTKRFVHAIGFCCPECFGFLVGAERFLRKVGIEGIKVKDTKPQP